MLCVFKNGHINNIRIESLEGRSSPCLLGLRMGTAYAS